MKILGKATKKQLDEGRKELKDYKCCYCGKKFQQYVGRKEGNGKNSTVSSQVKCPGCGNFLETW